MLALSHVELARLDALIEKLKRSNATENKLVVEHLQTAHAVLLGGMPVEARHNLNMALSAAPTLPDKDLRREVEDTIRALLQPPETPPPLQEVPRVHSSRPDNLRAAHGLREYFQGTDDTSSGIFYPKKHVVAVFERFDQAEEGKQILLAAGFRPWEVIAVKGDEVEKFLEELRADRTLWDALAVEVSRFLDTEINLVESYGKWARQGAGFLIAYSAEEADAEAVAELLKPLNATAMHWFMPGYIQHLLPVG
jgi:hypothetical protein